MAGHPHGDLVHVLDEADIKGSDVVFVLVGAELADDAHILALLERLSARRVVVRVLVGAPLLDLDGAGAVIDLELDVCALLACRASRGCSVSGCFSARAGLLEDK